jgi:hypothetical protein
MGSEGFLFYFGGLEVDLYSLDAAFVFATVVGTTVVKALWPCLWGVLQKWSLLEVQMSCNFVLRGRHSALDVSGCVFGEPHCQDCVKW